jgi:hypothetical protein
VGGTTRSIGGVGNPPSDADVVAVPGSSRSSLGAGSRNMTTSTTAKTPPIASSSVRRSSISRVAVRMPATSRIHTRPTGTRTFQPKRMNASYRMRGSTPRSHTKKKMKTSVFDRNHTIGNQPSDRKSTVENGQMGCQPPRNSVVASADTVTMLMYSARKNIANFSEVYSVWKPPTSSLSASGRSNGARFVSPVIAMT